MHKGSNINIVVPMIDLTETGVETLSNEQIALLRGKPVAIKVYDDRVIFTYNIKTQEKNRIYYPINYLLKAYELVSAE